MLNALFRRKIHRNLLFKSTVNVTRACNTSSKTSALNFKELKYPTKVPLKPIATSTIKSEKVTIDRETIELLMRLSLVNLSDE